MKLIGLLFVCAVSACYAAVIQNENDATHPVINVVDIPQDVNDDVIIKEAEVPVFQRKNAARANLILGSIGSRHRLYARQYFRKNPLYNTIQYEDFIYRGNSSSRITSIRATEVGVTQYASAFLLAGGLNRTTATIRMQSYRGYGYYYQVEIWGV